MAEMTAREAIRILTELAHHLTQVKRGGSSLDLGEIAALIEQQAQEIERLQIREHRMVEYMRDVKNFAFTINEVANNAIEEAEESK